MRPNLMAVIAAVGVLWAVVFIIFGPAALLWLWVTFG